MLKYRIWESMTGSAFQYHWKYFDTMQGALDEAENMQTFGVIEEWQVDLFEEKIDDFIDITCNDFGLFDFTLNEEAKTQWLFVNENRVFPCPGFVFNYYKRNVDEFITIEEIFEIVVDKDENRLAS